MCPLTVVALGEPWPLPGGLGSCLPAPHAPLARLIALHPSEDILFLDDATTDSICVGWGRGGETNFILSAPSPLLPPGRLILPTLV